MSDPRTLADRLERSQQTYICRMPDGQNSIIVRSKADELDECYTLMRAAAALLRHHATLLDAIGDPDGLRAWAEDESAPFLRRFVRRIADTATHPDPT